jgi:formylglycine-generating enzyme required for sulfatase activity
VAAEVCTPPGDEQFYADPAFGQHPVVYVTYEQAANYCTWAGKRLPSEAEWEKAARWDEASGTSLVYPWGNGYESGRANTASAGQGGTSAVQAFAQDRSPSGVLDLAGNVSEWVADWYFGNYEGLGTLNPTGPGTQPLSQPFRVVRGGSFQALAAYARAGQRFDVPPNNATDWIGFRCAMGVAGVEIPTAAPTPTETLGTPEATPTGALPATITPTAPTATPEP